MVSYDSYSRKPVVVGYDTGVLLFNSYDHTHGGTVASGNFHAVFDVFRIYTGYDHAASRGCA